MTREADNDDQRFGVEIVRGALQDAASVAGLLATPEAMVAGKPEKKSAPMSGGDGGMGGMDF